MRYLRFPDLPSPAEIAASALLVVSLVTLGLASKQWFLIGPLIAPSLWAPCVRLRLPREPGRIGYALLAFSFAALGRFLEVPDRSQLGFNVPYYVALFLETMALLKTLSPASAGTLPAVIFGSASAMATAGPNIPAPTDHPASFQYPIALALYALPLVVVTRGALRSSALEMPKGARAVRFGALVVFLLATLGLTVLGSQALERNYEELNNRLLRGARKLPLDPAGGFSGVARLGDLVRRQGNEGGRTVEIRAFSGSAPGYLRGMTFSTYKDRVWSPPVPREETTVRASEDALTARYVLPGRASPDERREPDMTIHPSATNGAHYFLPLETAAIETPGEHLVFRPGGTLTSPFEPTSAGYGVFLDPSPVVSLEDEPSYRELPEDAAITHALDFVIAKLARKDASVEEAERAVRIYFAERYRYQIGIGFAAEPDPVVQFLREKDHGHCELFATTGALLLRRMGFRARYVTGFLCEERNGQDLWLARTKHAHAWGRDRRGRSRLEDGRAHSSRGDPDLGALERPRLLRRVAPWALREDHGSDRAEGPRPSREGRSRGRGSVARLERVARGRDRRARRRGPRALLREESRPETAPRASARLPRRDRETARGLLPARALARSHGAREAGGRDSPRVRLSPRGRELSRERARRLARPRVRREAVRSPRERQRAAVRPAR
ncbi:transglutaminase domain-containing protein [bacterium]|nr:transglutaminase domain-containing protein [bacterium]